MIYSLTFQQFLFINPTKIECEIIISSFVAKFVTFNETFFSAEILLAFLWKKLLVF
jgi:hypothetical protein